MGLREGSIVLVICAHNGCEMRVTLIRGDQKVRCAKCGHTTCVRVTVDQDENCEIETWAY